MKKKISLIRGIVLSIVFLFALIACQMPAEGNGGDSDGNKDNNSSNNNGQGNTDNSGDITTPVVVKKLPLPEVKVVNQAAVDALQTYPEVELFCGENGVSAGADIFYTILQGPYTPGDSTTDLVEKKYTGGKLPYHFEDITIFVRAAKKGFENSDTVNYYFPKLTPPELGISWDKRGAATNISDTTIDEVAVVKSEGNYHLWYSKNSSIYYASSLDGVTWNNSSTAPVLKSDHRLESLDSDGVRVGAVIYDEEDRLYKMWYLGERGGVRRIFYAVANQAAGPWVKYPNDQFTPDGLPQPVMSEHADYPGGISVIKESFMISDSISKTLYRMWFTVSPSVNRSSNKVNQIYSAYSLNGTTWNASLLQIMSPTTDKFDSTGRECPQVIKDYHNDIVFYKLWYLAGVPNKQLGLGYNITDGQSFNYYTPEHTPLSKTPANIKNMAIIKDGLIYKMWYIHRGSDGIDKISYIESH